MIRYSYNQQYQPPAPFVHVTLQCPQSGKEITDFPALLDCAADRTVIPGKLVADLGLVPLEDIAVSGFGGQIHVVSTYRVEMGIRGSVRTPVEVTAHDGEPVVLLGRDILNRHNVALLGPALKLGIDK